MLLYTRYTIVNLLRTPNSLFIITNAASELRTRVLLRRYMIFFFNIHSLCHNVQSISLSITLS